MANGKPWTAEEDGLIQREYPFGGYRRMLELLPHRSKQAVISRASWLEVGARLTDHDKRLIRDLYPDLTKQAIAEKFGVDRRTIYSVLKVVA